MWEERDQSDARYIKLAQLNRESIALDNGHLYNLTVITQKYLSVECSDWPIRTKYSESV